MSNSFKDCLKSRGLLKFPRAEKGIRAEIKSAREDLKESQDRFKRKRFKYATITGYYSLFHAARALLYWQGYREKSHRCLRAGIKELLVKEKVLDPEMLGFFDEAIGLREAADYQSLYSKSGAEKAIKGAEKFLAATKEILKNR